MLPLNAGLLDFDDGDREQDMIIEETRFALEGLQPSNSMVVRIRSVTSLLDICFAVEKREVLAQNNMKPMLVSTLPT